MSQTQVNEGHMMLNNLKRFSKHAGQKLDSLKTTTIELRKQSDHPTCGFGGSRPRPLPRPLLLDAGDGSKPLMQDSESHLSSSSLTSRSI